MFFPPPFSGCHITQHARLHCPQGFAGPNDTKRVHPRNLNAYPFFSAPDSRRSKSRGILRTPLVRFRKRTDWVRKTRMRVGKLLDRSGWRWLSRVQSRSRSSSKWIVSDWSTSSDENRMPASFRRGRSRMRPFCRFVSSSKVNSRKKGNKHVARKHALWHAHEYELAIKIGLSPSSLLEKAG